MGKKPKTKSAELATALSFKATPNPSTPLPNIHGWRRSIFLLLLRWRIRASHFFNSNPLAEHPARERFFTQLSLLTALAIPAVQAMGVAVNSWLASFLWIGVLFVVLLIVWYDINWPKYGRVLASVFAIVGVSSLCYRSFAGPIVPMGEIEVSFFEDHRMPADAMKFTEIKDLPQALSALLKSGPYTNIPLKPGADGKIKINIIMRNPTRVPIKNATLTIISNVNVTGETNGTMRFTDKEIYYETKVIRPFNDLQEESYHTVSFEMPKDNGLIGIVVTVESDNSVPYTGNRIFQPY